MSNKRKVAILGGGMGALASAYRLTSEPGWQDRYDVTVYSLGWRLGGKGATGRDPALGYRILEHGLHMWFGFYDECFGMMRNVFKELNRPPGHPLRKFEDAFLPENIYSMEHEFQGQWYHWNLYMPPNDRTPGDKRPLNLADYVLEAVRLLEAIITGHYPSGDRIEPPEHHSLLGRWLDDLAGAVQSLVHPGAAIAHALVVATKLFSPDGGAHRGKGAPLLCALIRTALKLFRAALGKGVETDLTAYRAWIAADMLGTILVGALADDVLTKGIDSLNDRDWKKWLVSHGLSEVTQESCLVQVGYDSSFGFFRGHYEMEAGTMLSGAIKLYLEYKGSLVYRFAAGTGDTVFAALYECLKARGVRFELFTKINEIVCDGDRITAVKGETQARPKAGAYDPFIKVNGLACWPKEPKYELLREGDELKRRGVDLESYWADWRGEAFEMKAGVHFDDVVCGISVASLPALTPTLRRQSPRWDRMVREIKTTRTQAFQLWLEPTLQELGWPFDKAIVSCNGEPLDSWADLSCTLPFEDWRGFAGKAPGSVQYFCGAIIAKPDDFPGPEARQYPAEQAKLARAGAFDYMRTKLARTLPGAVDADGPRWDLMVGAPAGVTGERRFDWQWCRANVDPSERYVLSVVGSSQWRLPSAASGFGNLYLAGDWTDNGVVNAGCMEAACLSGLQAAEGILKAEIVVKSA